MGRGVREIVSFECKFDRNGLVEVAVKGDSIDEIKESIPMVSELFENSSIRVTTSEGGKAAVLELTTEIPSWMVENVGDWNRKELVLQIFLAKENQPLKIDDVEMDGRNLGVDMKSWISHNFKRDLGGDVLEVQREGTSKVYKLSAIGLAKAKAFRSRHTGT